MVISARRANTIVEALSRESVSSQTIRHLQGSSNSFKLDDWQTARRIITTAARHHNPQYARALQCLAVGYLDRLGLDVEKPVLSPTLLSDITTQVDARQNFIHKQAEGSRIPGDILAQMRNKTALHRALVADGRQVAATFCSARYRPETIDVNRAFTYSYLGARFFGDRLYFLNGGGPGLMGVTSAGVALADFDLNATVSLDLRYETPHTIVPPNRTFKAKHFAVRKPGLMDITGILQVMIGGFGTLEEVAESATRNFRGEVVPGMMNLMYTSALETKYPSGVAGLLREWFHHQATTGIMDLEQADWLFRNLYFTGSYRDYMQTTPIILSQLEARQRRQFADNNVISHPDNEAAYRASLREDLEASQIFDFIDPERSVSVLGPSEQLQDKFQNDAAETVRKLLSRGINVILTGTPDYLGRMISMAEELKDAGHLIVVQHITDPKPRMPEVSQRTSLVRFRNSNIMNMAMINGAYYYMAYPGFLNDDFTLEVVTAMQTLKLEERDLVQISPGNLHDPFRRIVNALKAHETINPEDRKLIQYENRGRGALRIFAAQGLFDHTSPPRQLHYIKEPELHNKGEKPEKKNMDLIMIECLLRPVLGRDHASRVSKALVALGVTPAFVAKERERILAAHPEEGAKYKESRSHYGPSILNFALLLALKANALGIPLGAPIDAFFPERAQEGPHYTAELLALLESGTGRSRKELMEEMKRLIGAQREEELEGVAG